MFQMFKSIFIVAISCVLSANAKLRAAGELSPRTMQFIAENFPEQLSGAQAAAAGADAVGAAQAAQAAQQPASAPSAPPAPAPVTDGADGGGAAAAAAADVSGDAASAALAQQLSQEEDARVHAAQEVDMQRMEEQAFEEALGPNVQTASLGRSTMLIRFNTPKGRMQRVFKHTTTMEQVYRWVRRELETKREYGAMFDSEGVLVMKAEVGDCSIKNPVCDGGALLAANDDTLLAKFTSRSSKPSRELLDVVFAGASVQIRTDLGGFVPEGRVPGYVEPRGLSSREVVVVLLAIMFTPYPRTTGVPDAKLSLSTSEPVVQQHNLVSVYD